MLLVAMTELQVGWQSQIVSAAFRFSVTLIYYEFNKKLDWVNEETIPQVKEVWK